MRQLDPCPGKFRMLRAQPKIKNKNKKNHKSMTRRDQVITSEDVRKTSYWDFTFLAWNGKGWDPMVKLPSNPLSFTQTLWPWASREWEMITGQKKNHFGLMTIWYWLPLGLKMFDAKILSSLNFLDRSSYNSSSLHLALLTENSPNWLGPTFIDPTIFSMHN